MYPVHWYVLGVYHAQSMEDILAVAAPFPDNVAGLLRSLGQPTSVYADMPVSFRLSGPFADHPTALDAASLHTKPAFSPASNFVLAVDLDAWFQHPEVRETCLLYHQGTITYEDAFSAFADFAQGHELPCPLLQAARSLVYMTDHPNASDWLDALSA